ncbi:MAG: hypothetical protein JNK56_24255 [Myxococcales bacterium]|nr:hypothetical protein [Myxococcales bacterium]
MGGRSQRCSKNSRWVPCRSLLAADRGLLADFDAALAGPRPRWELLPGDLYRDFADIAWDHLVASGLAPAAGERIFIDRRERRCPDCEQPNESFWRPKCARCDASSAWGRRGCAHRRRPAHRRGRRRRHPFPPGGRPYAALPNPLTPMCELAALGVAIERLESDAVVVARKA